jgi:hypothetical protein
MSEKRVAVSVSTANEVEQYVEIDGARYLMVGAEDLELRDILWLAKAGKQIQQAAGGDYSEEDIGRIEETLDRMIKTILPDLPFEVFARLKTRHKMAIVSAFTVAAAPSGEAPRPTGTEGSPDSSGSTAEAAPSGSPLPPPPSSGTPT